MLDVCTTATQLRAARFPAIGHGLALVAALTLASVDLGAQDPAAAARIERARAALRPVAKMAGQWEGIAEARMGPGTTLRIAQEEDIVWGASNTVLMIRGTGRGTTGADSGRVVFEAAALIWYDQEQDRLQMVSHRDGQSVEPQLEFRADTMFWGFEVPGGRVRYATVLTDSTWTEVGHFIREGAPPFEIVRLRLRRR